MDSDVFRWLVIIAFGVHGLGMIGAAGYLPFDRKGGFVGASWLLGAGAFAVTVGVVVWSLAGLGYVLAAYGFWQDADWWRSLAWIGAALTLVAITLWVGKIPGGVYVGGVLAGVTIGYLIFG